MLFYLMLVVAVVGQDEILQSWIWGEGVPQVVSRFADQDEDMKLLSDYSDHGFIQLLYRKSTDGLTINLVKRPPGRFYSESEPFCSKMLPAAIARFLEHHQIPTVSEVSVVVDGHPYLAACKCYIRVMISMGLARVGEGSGVVVTPSLVEDFCGWRPKSIVGKPTVPGAMGHSPASVSEADTVKLSTSSSMVLVDIQ